MSHAPQIQSLIDEIKQDPNSLERNKMVSHLEDAKAYAIAQTAKVPSSLAATAPASCTCVMGAIARDCPQHGHTV